VHFPLLAKDLTERAARPRTYVLRALFGLVLVAWFAWAMRPYAGESSTSAIDGSIAMMGAGRNLFATLSTTLSWALLCLQPMFMASVLTHEKERGTLSLLLLTPQRPWKLLLEKYLAGLLPVATLLLFGVPLGAVAYAYGGVTPATLVGTGMVILVTWLQTGAVALFCSAWCRTTSVALLASYTLLGTVYYATSPDLRSVAGGDYSEYDRFVAKSVDGAYLTGGGTDDEFRLGTIRSLKNWRPSNTFPLALLANAHHQNVQDYLAKILRPGVVSWGRSDAIRVPQFTLDCLWGVLIAGIFFLLARVVLIRRADPRPPRFLPRLFARVDAVFHGLNQRFGGVRFGVEREAHLAESPILWRETTRGLLGRPEYLMRFGIGIVIVVFAVSLPSLIDAPNSGRFAVSLAWCIHWLVWFAMLLLLVLAVNAIASERSDLTLDVLLSTPLPRRQILLHKAWPLLRVALAFFFVLLLLFAARAIAVFQIPDDSYINFGPDRGAFKKATHVVTAVVSLAALLLVFWQVRWLGLWLGLRIHSRSKALLAALGVLLGWMLVPRAAAAILAGLFPEDRLHLSAWVDMLAPDGLFAMSERNSLRMLGHALGFEEPKAWQVLFPVGLILLLHSILGLALRQSALRYAESRLHD
jgi:ABC-type transport system involved in multi-copper enzyme maturation permease subunit